MEKSAKSRLDQLLVERGLAESRAKAQALVMAGTAFSGGRRLTADAPLEVRGGDHP